MSTRITSSPTAKLRRVRWYNLRVAYCPRCQRSYPWQTEHCPACRDKLIPKIEHVAVEEH